MRWVQRDTPPAPARRPPGIALYGQGLFPPQMYRDTLEQLVDRSSKVVTATYCRAQHTLDAVVKRHHPMLRATLQSFHTICPVGACSNIPRAVLAMAGQPCTASRTASAAIRRAIATLSRWGNACPPRPSRYSAYRCTAASCSVRVLARLLPRRMLSWCLGRRYAGWRKVPA
jgi:hypothetical protein